MITFISSSPCKISFSGYSRALATCPRYERSGLSLSISAFRGTRLNYQPTMPYRQGSFPVFQPCRAMFSGGGILGVGASEIVVIVAVGWLLLGPQKLFSLAKDTGKIIGELRRTATEAKETFTEAMEMDILASEAEGLEKQQSSSTGMDTGQKDNTVKEVSTLEETNGQDVPHTTIEEALVSSMEGVSSGSQATAVSPDFLDQLKRVADPNQVAPSDVPDLSVEDDEEKQFEKLEREYFAAKSRMERRRKSEINSETVSDSTGAGNERLRRDISAGVVQRRLAASMLLRFDNRRRIQRLRSTGQVHYARR